MKHMNRLTYKEKKIFCDISAAYYIFLTILVDVFYTFLLLSNKQYKTLKLYSNLNDNSFRSCEQSNFTAAIIQYFSSALNQYELCNKLF